MKTQMRGYRGETTLVSPTGEQKTLSLRGREVRRYHDGTKAIFPSYSFGIPERVAKQAEREFRRLLSQGWKVVCSQGGEEASDQEGVADVGEEEKKNTDLVIGTSKTGDVSHGGDHASGEVEDSPNRAKRGCRGGRGVVQATKRREREEREGHCQKLLSLKRCGGVYSPTPVRVHPKAAESVRSSAELLRKLVGRSQLKVRHGATVDAQALMVALETGDNPLPPLEAPDERPRARVLLTPDCSGSCQNWSSLAQGWALALAKLPDVDVVYMTNVNGELGDYNRGLDSEAEAIISRVDVVIYCGDKDGYSLCKRYADFGADVVALDNYVSGGGARLAEKYRGRHGGTMWWIDRVSADMPDTWFDALELALGR